MKPNKLKELLKIDYPIIQAPMAGSDNPRLVAACSNAGILGSLGAQYLTPSEIEKAITDIRSQTARPFGINLFALKKLDAPPVEMIRKAIEQLRPYYDKFEIEAPTIDDVINQIDADAQLKTILEAKVPVFSFTLGMLDAKWIKAFKNIGTILIGTATTVSEAVALEEAGIDIVCAQGVEAGGHRGTFMTDWKRAMIGSMSLIPQVVDAVSIPVIAAGGIMDGRGIAAAFALGASGVQMGTAFLTVEESPVHSKYKSAIKEHDGEDTTITKVFSGGAARGINNKFVQENRAAELLPFPFHNALTKPFRKIANKCGDLEYTNLWCGQSGKLSRTLSVDSLVQTLLKESKDAYKMIEQLNE